jgi:hypothetical protein
MAVKFDFEVVDYRVYVGEVVTGRDTWAQEQDIMPREILATLKAGETATLPGFRCKHLEDNSWVVQSVVWYEYDGETFTDQLGPINDPSLEPAVMILQSTLGLMGREEEVQETEESFWQSFKYVLESRGFQEQYGRLLAGGYLGNMASDLYDLVNVPKANRTTF